MLAKYGQCSKDELESLSRNMQSLRIGTQVSCLSPKALDQIRVLLNLSDQAVMKVRESRVLAALRFELMDERFHDVEEAHEKTYDWIFESSPRALDKKEDGNRLGSYLPCVSACSRCLSVSPAIYCRTWSRLVLV